MGDEDWEAAGEVREAVYDAHFESWEGVSQRVVVVWNVG